MQVSVEALDTVGRRVTVRLPAEKIATEAENQIKVLARKVKIDGFRPGKVPIKVVKQFYLQHALHEAADKLIAESLNHALEQEDLHPLHSPAIDFNHEISDHEDFEYTASFEVLPQLTLQGLEGIAVERPTAEITEQDVDEMLESLRWQHVVWNEVQRHAARKDRITLDFQSKIDDHEFPPRNGVTLILDGKTKVPAFEEQLLGLCPDTETEFTITLPDDYQYPSQCGKTAHFSVKINKLEEPTLPALDDDLAAKFDVFEGGVTALRTSVREKMERNLSTGIKDVVKQQVMSALARANQVQVPSSLLTRAVNQMATRIGLKPDQVPEHRQLALSLFGDRAAHQVGLGLIISALAKRENMQANQERVKQILEEHAADYQDPEEMISSCLQNEGIMENLRHMVLEEQIVDWLLERGQVTEKSSTFTEIVAEPHMSMQQGLLELTGLLPADLPQPSAASAEPSATEPEPSADA